MVADDRSFFEQVASIDLLQSKAVQTELKVSEKQRTSLNAFAAAYNTETKNLADGVQKGTVTQGEFRAKVQAAQDALKVKIFTELTSDQTRRLGQISLQQAGYVALMSPLLAEKLAMTEAQRSKLKGAWNAMGQSVAETERRAKEPIWNKYRAMKPKDTAERDKLQKEMDQEILNADAVIRPKLLELRKGFEDTVAQTLTAGQKKAWDDLKGPAFKPKS